MFSYMTHLLHGTPVIAGIFVGSRVMVKLVHHCVHVLLVGAFSF